MENRALEVYKITSKVNGKIYIGITIQGVDTRWMKHCSDAECQSPFPIHNAIRKYGKENFQIEVIEIIEDEDFDYLKEREKYWIQEFDSYNREKGYNLTIGGDGTFGRFHSEETKEKIRQKAIGRKVSDKTKSKMSESQKRVNRNYSELAKKSNERWSDPNERLKASENNHNSKCVVRISKDNEAIDSFRSCSEAARFINVDNGHANISKCANGKLKSAYGYKWAYLEDLEVTNQFELTPQQLEEIYDRYSEDLLTD